MTAAHPRQWAASTDGAAGLSAAEFFAGPCGTVLWQLHEAVLLIDERQALVALNPAAERLLGCRAEDVLGSSMSRFVPAHWRHAHGEWVHRIVNEGSSTHAMSAGREVALLRADGRQVPVEVALARVEFVEAGHARTYFAALMRDRSEAQAIESHAAERRLLARELHDSVGHHLAALKIELAQLAHSVGLGAGDARVACMATMIEHAQASVRRMSGELGHGRGAGPGPVAPERAPAEEAWR